MADLGKELKKGEMTGKQALGVLGGIGTVFALIFGINYWGNHGFGTRQLVTEHRFNYSGQEIEVVRQDLILQTDKYFLRFENGDVVKKGELTDDSGNKISVYGGRSYSINDEEVKK